jgi:hypothetical protein
MSYQPPTKAVAKRAASSFKGGVNPPLPPLKMLCATSSQAKYRGQKGGNRTRYLLTKEQAEKAKIMTPLVVAYDWSKHVKEVKEGEKPEYVCRCHYQQLVKDHADSDPNNIWTKNSLGKRYPSTETVFTQDMWWTNPKNLACLPNTLRPTVFWKPATRTRNYAAAKKSQEKNKDFYCKKCCRSFVKNPEMIIHQGNYRR